MGAGKIVADERASESVRWLDRELRRRDETTLRRFC